MEESRIPNIAKDYIPRGSKKLVDLSKGGLWNRNSPLNPKIIKKTMMMMMMRRQREVDEMKSLRRMIGRRRKGRLPKVSDQKRAL